MPLPVCCTAPEALWPFTLKLPAAHLHSCRLDPAAMSCDAFAQAGIAMPRHIQQAAAKRQTEFLAGRLCARAALQSHAQLPCEPDQDDDGMPLWPAGLCGSITHSKGMAAAVVASQQHWQGIGLDAELLMSTSRAQRLAGQILTADELQRLQQLPECEHAWWVSLTFCSKESLFKALFPLVGQRFYFQDAELLECHADGQLQLRLLRDLAPQWPQGSLLNGQHATLGNHLLSLVSIAAGA
jgi:enterobactin synthetase component D